MRALKPQELFTKTACDYDQYRPRYPKELVEWIKNKTKIPPGGVMQKQ